jgi:hypothetical protein
VPTERGDIVRVWEYDRVNHTVWSVDMLFEGDTLWAHPRITNPSATQDLNGYWWTNVGQKITVAGTERVVMPAKYDYAGVPWCVTCLLSPSILAAVTQANWRAMHSVRSITGRQATTSFQRVQWARTTEWTAVARTSQACPSVPFAFACKIPVPFSCVETTLRFTETSLGQQQALTRCFAWAGSDYSRIGNLPTGHDFFMRLCDNETAPPIWGAKIPEHCKASQICNRNVDIFPLSNTATFRKGRREPLFGK